jgi:L-methionine (R)-S-oxide reductase
MSSNAPLLDSWLESFIRNHGGIAGTVHVLSQDAAPVLSLAAAKNIPPPVVEVTRTIPKGKGMAGLAWERGCAVQTCNLQTDKTGDVRPGAKAVQAQAAVALPVNDEHGKLRAVVGIAFADERELGEDELARLQTDADGVPQ